MARLIPVLGIEADSLRAVRLTENGKDFVCDMAEEWSFAPVEEPGQDGQSGPEAPEDADGGGAADMQEGEDPLVDAFRAAVKRFGTREFALALPLSRFLVKGVRVPEAERDTLGDAAQVALDGMSPFPDDPLTAGYEVVAETDTEVVAVAAGLPEASSPDVVAALEAAKIRVTRVDVLALGWLRALWPRISAPEAGGALPPARRLVLLSTADGWDMIVLDDGAPSIMRGLGEMSSAAELGREVMLSLLQGDAGGEIGDVVVFSPGEVPQDVIDRLGAFGPVRVETIEDPFAGVEGCARRAAEGSALDATPAVWAQLRNEARYKKRLGVAVVAAAAVWFAIMGVLFGVPFVYDKMRESENAKIRRHAKAYKDVKDMRDKVKLVRRYSDHARGALEMFKAVSDRMPDGITLTAFQYKRGVNVHVTGEADQPTDVYSFKERLDQIVVDDEPVFADVRMPGVSGRGGKNKFDIDASFESEDSK
jgi:hypothetical protein